MRHSDEIKSQAIALYATGLTMADVAKVVGTSTMSVQRWVKASGVVKSRPRGRRVKEAE